MYRKLIAGAGIFGLALVFNVALAIPVSATHIGTDSLTNGAVTTAKLAVGAVTNSALLNGAVNTDKLAVGSVTTSALASNAVTTAKISDGTIVGADVSTAADLDVDSVTLADADASETESGQVVSAVTVPTGGTGSFQNFAGDLTYEGAAGGTSTYHAGVMGNFLGTALTNTTSSYHAGVIGSYNVETSDASTGAEAGVVGEVGTDIGTAAAVMAVLGGDDGTLTPNAAYGVQYFNSTAASKFDYGLDLSHAATTDYGAPSAVDYGVADIRLASGATISSGSTTPATCVTGSLFLDTDGGTDATLKACVSTDTWENVDTTAI